MGTVGTLNVSSELIPFMISQLRTLLSLFVAGFFLIVIPECFGDLPDVTGDNKSSDDAVLTLHQVHDKGSGNYKKAATDAATNLASNSDLAGELKSQAQSSTHLSELTLRRIAAIESRCDIKFAYSTTNPSFRGYFQMGKDACTDVGINFSDISDPSQWRKSCEAGRLYLDLNWKRLTDSGASLTDGDKATLTLLYLMHQQGPGAAPSLWSDLNDGSAATTAASSNMRNNVGPKALAAIEGTNGRKLTELEFYAYWVGAIDAVCAQITQ
jgi:hypothetical protein